MVVGSVLLLLAFFTRYIVFEVVSIVALLLGIIYAFIGAESYVRADVARRVASSSLLPLQQLLEKFDYGEKAVYLPPLDGAKAGRVLLPAAPGTVQKLVETGQLEMTDKGVMISSTGEVLFEAIEEEFSDLQAIELDYFLEWLPRVLVDGLGLAVRAEAVRKQDEITARLWSATLGQWHRQPWVGKVCEQIGCPINGAIALALAKTTGRAVSISGCSELVKSRITKMTFMLGPRLKT